MGLVDKALVVGRSEVFLHGLKTELACETVVMVSVGLDLVAATVNEGVLGRGFVVCESRVEAGGV